MADPADPPDPREVLRPLRRVRQVREFTDEPPTDAELDAIADVGRWSGSSRNTQPWRFLILRDRALLRRICDIGLPQTRALRTATAAIAIVLAARDAPDVGDAYDDGRAAERLLIAASMLGLGAGIQWVRSDVADPICDLLGLPRDRRVRTIIALGHPTAAALQPKAAPGEARLPREEAIFRDRWPAS
jgi:nitroreductase